MYPYDYDNYDILEESIDEETFQHTAHLKFKSERIRCPYCQRDNVAPYDYKKEPRKVLDVKDGRIPIVLYFENTRHICKDCKHTFQTNIYPTCIPDKARVSTSALNAIVDDAIDYPEKTLKDVAEDYKLSPTVVSGALRERIDSFEFASIKNLPETKLFFIYPLTYKKKCCYVVCGTTSENKPMLFDVRESYSTEDVEAYLKNVHFHDGDAPWGSYCEIDENMLAVLVNAQNLHPDSDGSDCVGIIRQMLKDEVNKYKLLAIGDYNNTVNGLLELISEDIDSDEITEDNVMETLRWYYEDEENEAIKKHLKTWYDFLDYYETPIQNAFMYTIDEFNFSKNLEFIKTFQKNNTPFEEMRFRLWQYAHNRQNVSMSEALTTGAKFNLYDVYMDLDEINKHFNDSWTPSDEEDESYKN